MCEAGMHCKGLLISPLATTSDAKKSFKLIATAAKKALLGDVAFTRSGQWEVFTRQPFTQGSA